MNGRVGDSNHFLNQSALTSEGDPTMMHLVSVSATKTTYHALPWRDFGAFHP
jgi:hypothetical protein